MTENSANPPAGKKPPVKPPGARKPGGRDTRAQRLAAALKSNLKRRKAQARGREQ